MVVEDGWSQFSYSSEIITRIVEKGIKTISPPSRIAWPNSHIPMSNPLEKNTTLINLILLKKLSN